MVQIVPAILATTQEEYKQKLSKIETSGMFEGGWVQIDLMDNKFVQNKSIEAWVVAEHPPKFKIEVQLMVAQPKGWIEKVGKVNRIIIPLEIDQVSESIEQIIKTGAEVGLSINPATPIEKLEPYVNKIDTVLVMSVEPGFGGQKFIAQTVDKVREIKDKRWPVKIGVDGGINDLVVKDLVDAGADYLVIGSHLIEGSIDENLEKIWEAIS
ncbi:ribulose-phosphate 3-epimerase [Candidatus Daviesbacteria bacterium]|nr:ribulose-phosphate 3-epimerase [Candidatus Daviesbacteria bacterium]